MTTYLQTGDDSVSRRVLIESDYWSSAYRAVGKAAQIDGLWAKISDSRRNTGTIAS
jgi:hypothetical protein